jgi:glycosyltransferase involved in cell wall biosynthesis
VKVSVIITVKDEVDSIDRLMESLAAQTRPAAEIVVVDGGSTDGTIERLMRHTESLPLRVLVRPGFNISQGRNAAIAAATGEIIASTDAGVRLEPQWLAELVAPIEANQADVASGFFVPDPHGAFETALGATTLPALADIDPQKFLPSSRSVAFRKSAWQQVGGYPEWLDYCEDLVFDFALRHAGFRFMFVPKAIVHFCPRPNLAAFLRQYYRYARGDGKADLWRRRHAVRYGIYLLLLPALLVLGLAHSPACWGLIVLGGAAMFWTPYKRLVSMLRGLRWAERLAAIAWVPIIRVAGDMAKMLGYPVGVWWRMRKKQ